MADELRTTLFEAPDWGWIGLVHSERGLRMLILPRRLREDAQRALSKHYPDAPLADDDPVLADIEQQVCAFLAGQRRTFDVQVDLRGHTSFELTVWAAAGRIGYGETRTYAWVAAQVGGGPGAAQAAGAALGANPVPLIVPCHRVIGSDGSLHGFAGGLRMKARLLALESGQTTLDGM